MTATAASTERDAIERAVSIVTAFNIAAEDDGDDAGEVIFEIVDELLGRFGRATTDREIELARNEMHKTFMAMASITEALLSDCADLHDIDKFDLIGGVAQSLYGSIA